ncbi:MAG: hypothetical protein ACSHYA_18470 [Opitutaceae bacterium]
MKHVNWSLIRNLGELHILTKASYAMLVLVPVVVSAWPIILLSYDTLGKSLQAWTLSIEEMVTVDPPLPTNYVKSEQDSAVREEVKIPKVWAIMFLSSLTVTLGHLIYQCCCPGNIRARSAADYVLYVRDFQIDVKSQSRLKRAKYNVEEAKKRKIYFSDFDFKNLESVTSTSVELDAFKQELLDEGAKAEYLILASSNRICCYACALFYLSSIMMIVWIIIGQTEKVFSAAF